MPMFLHNLIPKLVNHAPNIPSCMGPIQLSQMATYNVINYRSSQFAQAQQPAYILFDPGGP